MSESKTILGWVGIAFGSIALIVALVHFYAGPFAPQPTLEQAVAEKAVAIKKATIAALKGEVVEAEKRSTRFNADRIIEIAIAVIAGFAIIFAAISFAKKESYRIAIGAAGLGAAAIAFQFLTIALGAIIFVILVAAILGSLGLS